MPEILSIAICICDGVTLSDFITPVEILAGLNYPDHPNMGKEMSEVPYRVKIDYLAPKLAPVVAMPTMNPTMTYTAAMERGKQFDILWIPAGPFPDVTTGADMTPKVQIDFIKRQAPNAKYVMSVYTGAVQLACAGMLEGKKATINKAFFKLIQAATSTNIAWVAKARWVVDGNIWTSSGITAGSDMALAFIEHIAGADIARYIRGIVEIPERKESEDPFAEFHGLV